MTSAYLLKQHRSQDEAAEERIRDRMTREGKSASEIDEYLNSFGAAKLLGRLYDAVYAQADRSR